MTELFRDTIEEEPFAESGPDSHVEVIEIAEGLLIARENETALWDKFAAFRAALVDQINPETGQPSAVFQLRTDYDQSITPPDGESTWKRMARTLPDKLRDDSEVDRRLQLALQDAGRLSLPGLILWSERETRRHAFRSRPASDIEQAVNDELRTGIIETLAVCAETGTQVIVITAGIANPALLTLERFGVMHAAVIGNELAIEQSQGQEVISGWKNQGNLVHTHNKCEHTEARFPRLPGQKRYIFVFGDGLDDARMAEDGEDDVVIRIRAARAPHKGGNTPEYFDDSFRPGTGEDGYPLRSAFDIVLKSDDAAPLTKLIRRLTSRPQ